jgi:hypothetical protein
VLGKVLRRDPRATRCSRFSAPRIAGEQEYLTLDRDSRHEARPVGGLVDREGIVHIHVDNVVKPLREFVGRRCSGAPAVVRG